MTNWLLFSAPWLAFVAGWFARGFFNDWSNDADE